MFDTSAEVALYMFDCQPLIIYFITDHAPRHKGVHDCVLTYLYTEIPPIIKTLEEANGNDRLKVRLACTSYKLRRSAVRSVYFSVLVAIIMYTVTSVKQKEQRRSISWLYTLKKECLVNCKLGSYIPQWQWLGITRASPICCIMSAVQSMNYKPAPSVWSQSSIICNLVKNWMT